MSDFRKPWERSEFHSDRPARSGGFRKPWEHDGGGDRPARSGFRKPWDRDEGGDRPARSGGFRKPWDRDGGDRPARFGGFRKPWERNDASGAASPDGRAPSRPERPDRPFRERGEGECEQEREPRRTGAAGGAHRAPAPTWSCDAQA